MNSYVKDSDWKEHIPLPIYDKNPGYKEFYLKAWELAFAHIKETDGMPQSPYMDEAFCDTQIWIWDSCFMSLFCKYAMDVFPGIETLRNFYEVLYDGKHLPKVIPSENEPAFKGLIHGVPYEMLVHIADNPPLFAWAEYENALFSGNISHIKELLYDKKYLQKHYKWIENLKESVTPGGVHSPTCLISEKYGYKWEGGRSGMDNTPRGRKGERAEKQRPNNPDMLWIDAICQQALSARMISKLFAIVQDFEESEKWNECFVEKKEIINSFYWDEKDGFFYDIDCNTHEFYKVMSVASYWTLTSNAATAKQAECLVNHLNNPDTFGGFVPFSSVSRNDADFNSDGVYWRGGVWLPTAYAALKGLVNYNFYNEAHVLGEKLLRHMYRTYNEFEPHTIWESYSPSEYKPSTNEHGSNEYVRPDFCGWSALGPVSVFIEFVLGFHTINAFTKTVEWAKPNDIKVRIGIMNLKFGDIVTDIESVGNTCNVKSNGEYTLVINGKVFNITKGVNEFDIK